VSARLSRTLRQVLTIARRDFTATVFTPVFLLFLFAPVIMGGFGAIGGAGASSVAGSGRDRARVVAIVPDALARSYAEADARLRAVFRDDAARPALTTLHPTADPAAQARAAFSARDYDAAAVLYGPAEAPVILRAPQDAPSARYLALLSREALADRRLGAQAPRVIAREVDFVRAGNTAGDRDQSAFFAVFGVFFLTLFLAGQVVGTMAEERNNKVVEVLAAAVPLEAVFLGKLLGLFGVAVMFVAFWGTVLAQLSQLVPPSVSAGLASLTPAVGGDAFAILFFAYFTTAYLLLGSVFLGVGAQASTMREIQMLSLPITVIQVGMFALSTAAARAPGSPLARFAELFPLSSPFAMAGRAANRPEIWPHLAALAWQLGWVALFIGVGARLFRRGVLQSGSPGGRWFRWRTKAAAGT